MLYVKGKFRLQVELRSLNQLLLKQEIILFYPGGPNLTTKILKSKMEYRMTERWGHTMRRTLKVEDGALSQGTQVI